MNRLILMNINNLTATLLFFFYFVPFLRFVLWPLGIFVGWGGTDSKYTDLSILVYDGYCFIIIGFISC